MSGQHDGEHQLGARDAICPFTAIREHTSVVNVSHHVLLPVPIASPAFDDDSKSLCQRSSGAAFGPCALPNLPVCLQIDRA